MDVNLRKASALCGEIGKYIARSGALAPQIHLSIYEKNVPDVVAKKRDESITLFRDVERLQEILYGIRNKCKKKFDPTGISDLLNEKELLNQRLQRLSLIQNQEPFSPEAAAMSQAVAAKRYEANPEGYRSTDTFPVQLYTAEDIATFRATAVSIRRRLQKISDELLALNTNTTIEISDDDMAFLERLEIV